MQVGINGPLSSPSGGVSSCEEYWDLDQWYSGSIKSVTTAESKSLKIRLCMSQVANQSRITY